MNDTQMISAIRSEIDSLRRFLEETKPFKRQWLTVAEVAEYLRLSQSQVRALINDGYFPYHRIKGAIRINTRELDKAILKGLTPDSIQKKRRLS